MCVSKCMCTDLYVSLCLCVINQCLTLYRTHNTSASFSLLKINSSTSDVPTIGGQENDSYSLRYNIKLSQSGQWLVFYRGKGSRKWGFVKEKCSWRPTKSEYWERNGNKHTRTNMRARSWWTIPQGCWERSYSEVTQLWHQGFALCVIRFTIMSDTQEVTQCRNYTLWNTCSDARQTKVTALEILLQTVCN